MRIIEFLTGISTAAIVAATLATSAVPGAAATAAAPRKLPKGNRMFTIPCNTDAADYHLFSVDPTTAAFTSIGGATNVEGSTCAYGMAYDHKTRRSYFIAGNTSTENWPLMLVDLKTGDETFVGDISEGGVPLRGYPAVAAITNSGRGYVIVHNVLYKLDLKTAAATMVGGTGVVGDIYAFAVSPVNGRAYAVSEPGDVYRIDLKTGVGAKLGTVPTVDNSVYSLQIDTKGTFWINEGASASTFPPSIGSFRLSDIAGSLVGSSAPMTFYSGAFLIKH